MEVGGIWVPGLVVQHILSFARTNVLYTSLICKLWNHVLGARTFSRKHLYGGGGPSLSNVILLGADHSRCVMILGRVVNGRRVMRGELFAYVRGKRIFSCRLDGLGITNRIQWSQSRSHFVKKLEKRLCFSQGRIFCLLDDGSLMVHNLDYSLTKELQVHTHSRWSYPFG